MSSVSSAPQPSAGDPGRGQPGRGQPGPGQPGYAEEPEGPRFHGASIPPQHFSDDDGSAPDGLVAAVDSGDVRAVVSALIGARLLIGLVAHLDSATPEGMEKDSHMAAAMWQRPDGRVALMAFSSIDAMAEWGQQARPLPVPASQAAQAALEEGADALLIDRRTALAGPALWAVAQSRELLGPAEDPEVRELVESAVAATLGAAGVATEVRLLPVDDFGLTVVLDAAAAGERQAVTDLAAQLADDPVLRSRVSGLQLAVAPSREG